MIICGLIALNGFNRLNSELLEWKMDFQDEILGAMYKDEACGAKRAGIAQGRNFLSP
jgi:hypothetical protein